MIQIRDLTLRRGTHVVLQGAQLRLNPGEKVGLVGRNGAGKSSLFALLAGRLQADQGDLEIPGGWQQAEVAQSMPETSQEATDFVLDGDQLLRAAQDEVAQADHANDGHRIALAHATLEEVGGFDARSRAQALLLGLGFQVEELERPVNSFSGGWRMRLQLARALMSPSDLLLLDEPTNHLDLDALVWLEGWLQRYTGTLLIISHDREFLDAITGVTVHLANGQLTRYGGNYSAFEEQHAQAMQQQAQAYGKQQEQIAHLTRFIDRFRAQATKARQAQSRIKALERMERIAPILAAAEFQFRFREPLALPNPMLALRDLSCGYPGPIQIIGGITRSVMAGQRIGILGANGQGKSTLVKTITGLLAPLAGDMTVGKGLSVGYFAQQEMDVLHADSTPLEHMVRLSRELNVDAREQELRDFLGRFQFGGEMAHREVGSLSGGEKARLVLAMVVWQRPNLLLLDEPTNHLDLSTREALSVALNDFEGTVMLVSHDRALLREVCDSFWLVADGSVTDFDGDLDDYQRWLLDRSRERSRAFSQAAKVEATNSRTQALSPTSPPPAPGVSRKAQRQEDARARQAAAAQARPLRQELHRLETQLKRAQADQAALESSLAEPDLPAAERAAGGKRLKDLMAATEALEERWLHVSQSLDELDQTATPQTRAGST